MPRLPYRTSVGEWIWRRATSSAVPGPKSALQLAHPGPDCRVVRPLPQMKVSRGRNERQVIGRKEALEHFPTRPACAGNRRDAVGDPGSQIKFERGQAEFGASDGCRQCFLCRSDDCVLLVERGHRPRQARGQKHDPGAKATNTHSEKKVSGL
jgi:hypothetical protein